MTLATNTVNKEHKIVTRPFLKWAGGKSQLLKHLLPLIPDTFGKYMEPFLGGGALFFALGHKPSLISDSNEELIITYRALRDNVELVIETLKSFKNTKEDFYKLRSLNPVHLSNEIRAARLIYLNKTCFNGLYRVNRIGQFNTPYNGNEHANFLQPELLRDAHKTLIGTRIEFGDYEKILSDFAEGGDLIFLDPPYQPVGKYSDFKRYTKEKFHEQDQVNLANLFSKLVDKGCKVILTNSLHESILELYMGYDCRIVDSKRLISRNAQTRNGKDLIVLGGF